MGIVGHSTLFFWPKYSEVLWNKVTDNQQKHEKMSTEANMQGAATFVLVVFIIAE